MGREAVLASEARPSPPHLFGGIGAASLRVGLRLRPALAFLVLGKGHATQLSKQKDLIVAPR